MVIGIAGDLSGFRMDEAREYLCGNLPGLIIPIGSFHTSKISLSFLVMSDTLRVIGPSNGGV